jgi:hypothetical protein
VESVDKDLAGGRMEHVTHCHPLHLTLCGRLKYNSLTEGVGIYFTSLLFSAQMMLTMDVSRTCVVVCWDAGGQDKCIVCLALSLGGGVCLLYNRYKRML